LIINHQGSAILKRNLIYGLGGLIIPIGIKIIDLVVALFMYSNLTGFKKNG
jgi:high-affinity K+ transport system ATPase subunit B